jgi:hypothetical protein
VGTKCATYDSWYAVSTDLQVVKLPVISPGQSGGGGGGRGAVHVEMPRERPQGQTSRGEQ